MNTWFHSLASVSIVSAVSLVGVVTLAVKGDRLKNVLIIFVSFAVGGLFGDVFIHILPDLFEGAGNPMAASIGILSGIILFFILEKFICWRHCHSGVCDMHAKPMIWVNLIGDGLHNFIDGIIIAAGYGINFQIGLTTTLAVVLHEIPQEIGDFAILLQGGLKRGRALLMNFLCSLLAVLGAVVALAAGAAIHDFSRHALAVAAGGFIYLAGSDLIPELHREVNPARSLAQLVAILAGVLVMALLLFIE
jgi:zinc and cadmium transporter